MLKIINISISIILFIFIRSYSNRFDFPAKNRILTIRMVSVAQLAEHQTVALGVVGSNPTTHPSLRCFIWLERFYERRLSEEAVGEDRLSFYLRRIKKKHMLFKA